MAFAAAAFVAITRPTPVQTHDEWSYLLAADTFLHGRLANPTHPFWMHFESFHTLAQPSYASKYPPLQGAVLALGALLGAPVVGVVLSFAAACAAVCWMLRGWVYPGWALAGALGVALHPQLVAFWGTWLWGGAVPLLGGALVYGALPRISREPRLRDALWLGIGVASLALSRPFEGLVACVPAMAWLARDVVRRARAEGPAREVRRWAGPTAAVVLAALAFQGLYNQRVTGEVFTFPYDVYKETYAVVPEFLFMAPYPTKTYRHQAFRDFYGPLHHNTDYFERQSLEGYLGGVAAKLELFYRFFARGALALLGLALPFAWRAPGVRFAALSCVFFFAVISVATHEYAHYAAPVVPLLALLTVSAAQIWWGSRWRGFPVGRISVCALLAGAILQHADVTARRLDRRARTPMAARAALADDLASRGGRHVVFVLYDRGHNPHLEWVYNGAEIDEQNVVWARSLGPERDAALLDHYAGRSAWVVRADAVRPALAGHPARRPAE